MKKLIKNKFAILGICILIISVLYVGIQKIINNYTYNNEITNEEDFLQEKNNTNEELEEKQSSKKEEDKENKANDNSNILNSENINKEEEKIYIYIIGEVNKPGVVVLNKGSRIVDAINAAGGTTPKANLSKINLVYVLADGMKVNIPNDNDLKNNSEFKYITMNSGDSEKDEYLSEDYDYNKNNPTNNESNSNAYITSESKKENNVVNINTATQTELETLPGIGPSLALKIINYRKENGKFSSIDEIKNVSGIGDSKFEDLKKYITV